MAQGTPLKPGDICAIIGRVFLCHTCCLHIDWARGQNTIQNTK